MSTIGRSSFIFFLWLSLLATACSDLAVFVAPNKAKSSYALTEVAITERGFLKLAWENARSLALNDSRSYEVYQIELTADENQLSFSEKAVIEPLFTYEEITITKKNERPKAKGELVGSVDEPSFTSTELMTPGRLYILQIVAKAGRAEESGKVILVRPELNSFSATSSNLNSDTLVISWNPVPGANRYLVYADEAMTQRIGETTAASLAIDINMKGTLKSYYVQAFRGLLPATDVARIDIVGSNAKVVRVRSLSPDRSYKAGDVLSFEVEFSEAVTSYGDAALPITIGARTVQAAYTSGSGQNQLRFSYTVQNGDDIDGIGNGNVLIGTFVDISGQSISLTLPASTSATGLGAQSHIVLDTIAPTAPTAPLFTQSLSQTPQLTNTWTSGLDQNQDHDEHKLCTQTGCSQSCRPATSVSLPTQTSTGLADGSYYACVRTVDAAGNASTWIESASPATVDTIPPRVVRVYGTSPNGRYRAGDSIDIAVEFSENVWLSGGNDLSLTLETGTPDRSATYQSGSGTKTLSFRYLVHTGDTANPLNYVGTGSLVLGAGHQLRDIADLAADLLLPASNAATALGSQSQLLIDTTPPPPPVIVSPAHGSYLSQTLPTISGTAEANASIKIYSGSTEIASTTANGSGNFSVTLGSSLSDGPYQLKAKAIDATGNESSDSSVVTVTIDTAPPSAPASPSFPAPLSASTSLTLSWTESTDTNFNTHNVRLCTASDCETDCGSITTSANSPVTLSGVNGTSYYGCVQGTDLATQTSAWVATATPVTVDTTGPTVTRVTSSTSNGTYKAGDTISIQIKFSEPVEITGEGGFGLLLETGSTDHAAVYDSGAGSDTLSFTYTVQAGDTSSDLNYQSTAALTLGGGTIQDAAGNSANLTLPSLGSGNSLAGGKAIVLDTTPPAAPVITSPLDESYAATDIQTISGTSESGAIIKVYSGVTEIGSTTAVGTSWSVTLASALGDGDYSLSATAADAIGNESAPSATITAHVDTVAPGAASGVGFAGAETNTANFDLSWTDGSDDNFATHNVKICTSYDCHTGCTSETSSTKSPTSVLGANEITYFGCVQSVDLAGNTSSWVVSGSSIYVDMNNPSIINITSSNASGTYKAGAIITLLVKFSEVVDVTGSAGFALKLETGTVARDATYVSGSGTDTLTFTYTVQAGDTTSDLNYHSTSALTLGGGTIKDTSGNDADLTLPSLASSNSIAGQKTIILDTTAPLAPVILSPVDGSYLTSDLTTISGSSEANAAIRILSGGTEIATTTAVGTSWSVTLSPALTDGAYSLTATATDNAQNESPASTAVLATVDKIDPTAPASVGFGGSYATSTSFPLSWTNGSDTNFATHNAKICTQNDCDTGCTSVTTSVSTPVTVSGVNGSSYYGCVQGLDLAGRTSAWVVSTQTIAVDTSVPTVLRVSSPTANGTYKAGDTIALTVTFNEAVYVTSGGSLGLLLETGSTDHAASYVSGSGSATLSFSYTVQAGDTSSDLDYASTSALSVGAGAIKDVAGNDANLTLPALGSADSLAGQKAIALDTTPPAAPVITSPTNGSYLTSALALVSGTSDTGTTIKVYSGVTEISSTSGASGTWNASIGTALTDGSYSLTAKATDAVGNESPASSAVAVVVDTINPTNPSSVGFGGATANTTSFNLSWSNSTDTNFSTHNAKLCSQNDCTTGCISDTTATASPASVTGVDGATYYGCVQGLDLAGRTSSWVASALTIKVDTTAPTVTNVTSGHADGSYKAGASIPISVSFSENVVVTTGAGLGILLETGTTDRLATYTSGSGSSTLIFTYTVQAGDTSADLNYQSPTALTAGAGAIKDAAGNDADLELPALNAANALATQKAIVIDTTAPNVPVIVSPSHGSTLTNPLTSISGTAEANSVVEVFENNVSKGTTNVDGNGDWSLSFSPQYGNGSFTFKAKATDLAGNVSNEATSSITIAVPAPTAYAGADIYSQSASGSLVGSATNGVSYLWSKVSGPGSVSFGTANALTTNVTLSTAGDYVLKLTVTNSVGVTAESTLTYYYDTTPPTFSGVYKVWRKTPTSLSFYWRAATDNASASPKIEYDRCMATTAGYCSTNFTPNVVFSNGVFNATYTGLNANDTYYVAIRARDEAGNTTTSSITTMPPLLPSLKISVARSHNCAILDEPAKRVKCWGFNNVGQVGDGTTNNSGTPVFVTGLTDVIDIAAGFNHSCALLANGSVKCWGANGFGQLGNNSTTDSATPVDTGLSNVVSIAAGSQLSCAVLSSGEIKCWGFNNVGQVGDGTYSNRSVPTTVSGTGASPNNGLTIKAADGFACATFGDGTIRCWGYNQNGQLGVGSGSNSHNTPQTISSLTNKVTHFSVGRYSSCAVLNTGAVQCWGNNDSGKLGDGTTTNSNVPVNTQITTNASKVSVGHSFACALLTDGTVRCWGAGGWAQLGNGTLTSTTSPVRVTDVSTANDISSGNDHTCVRLSNKTIQCWGRYDYGQLGMGPGTNFYAIDQSGTSTTTAQPTPFSVDISNVSSIFTGQTHTCALLSTGKVRCWGSNDGEYRLGNSTYPNSRISSPLEVSNVSNAVHLAVARYHSCAVLNDGSMKCWGSNSLGELGNGSTSNSLATAVSGISGAVASAGGSDHHCALLSNGTVKCWGSNVNYELGNSSAGSQSLTPVDVTGVSNATQIASGEFATCVLISGGTVQCWGKGNRGQLGNGTTPAKSTVVSVSGISNATSISGGLDQFCARLADGTVKCWGYNNRGQLGNGNTTNQSTPVAVSGLTGAVGVSASVDHSCAVLNTGEIKCWGSNTDGMLGTESNLGADVTTPVLVTGIGNASFVGGGGYATCAILTTGKVGCWGRSSQMQLGMSSEAAINHTPSHPVLLYDN